MRCGEDRKRLPLELWPLTSCATLRVPIYLSIEFRNSPSKNMSGYSPASAILVSANASTRCFAKHLELCELKADLRVKVEWNT
jgi:hypothetical protein